MSQIPMVNGEDMEICRLCLKLESDSNLTPLLSGFFNEMLKEITLDMNLTISDNPVICYCCLEKLQKCVIFKTLCNVAGERKLDSTVTNVCSLCSNNVSNQQNLETNEYNQKCLRKYIPLITLPKENILCHLCEDILKTMDEFSALCTSSEAKINLFIKLNKYEGKVSLQKVIDFSKEYKWTDMGLKTLRNVDIKEEIDIELEEVKPNPISFDIKMEDDLIINGLTSQNLPPKESTQYNTNEKRIQSILLPRKDKSDCSAVTSVKKDEEVMFYCYNCPFQSKLKASLVRHMLVHKNYSEVETFQCNDCSFITKYKASLIVHLLVHKSPSEIMMFKCDECPYQTRLKKNLLYHKITHKNLSDSELYKCSDCLFVTKFKSNLAKHSVVHKSISEVTIYNCPHCPYETRFKRNLKKHSIVHKTPLETKMYECTSCNFTSKFKYSLIKHALIHKDISEVTMHQCTFCPFQTKFRYGLIRHSLIHKSFSEVPNLYECYHCPYKTKLKSNLVQHCMRHRVQTNIEVDMLRDSDVYNINNVVVYRCDSCPYETTLKSKLMSHSKMHFRQNNEC